MDEEVIAALSEPRFPCPEGDQSLHVIVLTQTVYLCQLFLHLQEFDPCAIGDDDDESLRVFQDALAREFNAVGPAPDGLVLERVVRGLMLAQREEPRLSTPPKPDSDQSPTDSIKTQLQKLLVAILEELNQPLHKKPIRYEARHGPRTLDTWAARFATRVMQWRALVRDPRQVANDVIEIQRDDVLPLDEGGMEVYRLIRDGAPGNIHIATPLQPPIIQHQAQTAAYAQRSQPSPRAQQAQQYQQPQRHQQQRSFGSNMGLQNMLRSPVAKKSGSSGSETSDTPRTTPQYPQAGGGGAPSAPEAAVKRGSQDLGGLLPPSKRPKSMQSLQSTSREALAAAGYGADSRIPIRGGVEDSTAEVGAARNMGPSADETNLLLRRVLDGVGELGHKMDGMRQEISVRFDHLDHRIRHIADWIGIAEDEG